MTNFYQNVKNGGSFTSCPSSFVIWALKLLIIGQKKMAKVFKGKCLQSTGYLAYSPQSDILWLKTYQILLDLSFTKKENLERFNVKKYIYIYEKCVTVRLKLKSCRHVNSSVIVRLKCKSCRHVNSANPNNDRLCQMHFSIHVFALSFNDLAPPPPPIPQYKITGNANISFRFHKNITPKHCDYTWSQARQSVGCGVWWKMFASMDQPFPW